MAERPGGDPKDTRPPLTIDLAADAPARPNGDKTDADSSIDTLALPAAAAAVGGVLGLTLALVFAAVGLWPASGGNTAEIERLRGDIAATRAEAEKLTARVGELTARPAPAPAQAEDGRLAALADRVAKQETALAALQARPATSVPQSTGGAPLPEARLDQIGTDLATLRETVQATAGLADRLAKVEATAAEMKAAVDVARPLPSAVSALDGRFDRLEATTTDVQRQTAAIEARLAEVTGKVGDVASARADAVLALALASLKTAVDSGRPFAAELAVATKLMPGEALQPLAGLAPKGVAPLPRLAAAFPELARRIGEAELARRTAGGSLVDKLMAQAKQSVSIRPIDEAAGPSVPARLARIEAALNAGRAAEALADWQGLPEAARALDPPFDAELAARTRVDGLLATATRTALERLAGRAP